MNIPELDDYRWLISEKARPFLEHAATSDVSLTALTKSLRRDLTQHRVHLILEQVELRRRGRTKFRLADQMYFTRKSLEQATSERIAAYKAKRFPSDGAIADLCCGIGGDLMALAAHTPTIAVDRDPIMALFANENCRVAGANCVDVQSRDVNDVPIDSYCAWHIDPDRRPKGRRTTRLESYEPKPEWIETALARNENAVIKLAPATTAPPSWAERAQLEWIGHDRECKQQLAWFGNLARNPGERSATILSDDPNQPHRITGLAELPVPVARSIGRYLYEPHAAVIAAKLCGHLAARCELAAVSENVPYLTSDKKVDDGVLTMFDVLEVVPFDIKRLKGLIRERNIGRLEVKKRGVPADPEKVRNDLNASGDHAATLFIFPRNGCHLAALAKRMSEPSNRVD